jgi:hypothetical protein
MTRLDHRQSVEHLLVIGIDSRLAGLVDIQRDGLARLNARGRRAAGKREELGQHHAETKTMHSMVSP